MTGFLFGISIVCAILAIIWGHLYDENKLPKGYRDDKIGVGLLVLFATFSILGGISFYNNSSNEDISRKLKITCKGKSKLVDKIEFDSSKVHNCKVQTAQIKYEVVEE